MEQDLCKTVIATSKVEWAIILECDPKQLVLDNPDAIGDCGHLGLSYLFFDLFYCIGNNILLNLFIAVRKPLRGLERPFEGQLSTIQKALRGLIVV